MAVLTVRNVSQSCVSCRVNVVSADSLSSLRRISHAAIIIYSQSMILLKSTHDYRRRRSQYTDKTLKAEGYNCRILLLLTCSTDCVWLFLSAFSICVVSVSTAASCSSCQRSLDVSDELVLECPTCRWQFCIECDEYIHNTMHNWWVQSDTQWKKAVEKAVVGRYSSVERNKGKCHVSGCGRDAADHGQFCIVWHGASMVLSFSQPRLSVHSNSNSNSNNNTDDCYCQHRH